MIFDLRPSDKRYFWVEKSMVLSGIAKAFIADSVKIVSIATCKSLLAPLVGHL